MAPPIRRPARLHLVMGVVAVGFLAMTGPFWIPVILGALMAAAANPLHVRLRRRFSLKPTRAAGLTTLLVGGGVVVPFALIFIAGLRATLKLIQNITTFVRDNQGQDLAESVFQHPLVARVVRFIDTVSPLDTAQIREHLLDVVQQLGTWLGEVLAGSLQHVPQTLVFLFLLSVAFFYILLDGTRLEAWVVRQSPFERERTMALVREVQKTAVATLLSSLVVATVQSVILFVGMLISGIPAAFAWFMVAFLSAFIPVVGTAPVGVGCVLYLLAQGRFGGAVVMIVCIVVAGISDNVVRPLVIGGGSQQHPLLMLVSIFGGLWALGFSGLFIGPVLCSLFLALLGLYMEDAEQSATLSVQGGNPGAP